MNGTMKINGQRLWQSLMDLAKIGATPLGGNCRLALTELDGQGRDLVVGWMRQAGLTIEVDQVGNIFGRRAGADNQLPPVMMGSHIDTQPTGGKFDGCYGVLAGLEVLRSLNDAKLTTRAPLELAIWTNEEGSRFVPVMMGSGAFIGKYSVADIHQAHDQQGISVVTALQDTGYLGTAPVGKPLRAYFEAHIEQGPILEQNDTLIGVVTGSLGLYWFDITVTGMEMHAGPTPMELRQDALMAASEMALAAKKIALDNQPHGRGTVGVMRIPSGSRNVVPGKVEFTLDLRHQAIDTLNTMIAQWQREAATIATRHRCQVDIRQVDHFPPTPFAPSMVEVVDQATQALGYSHRRMVTGAGHDAVYIASQYPTAMIFVPCKDGISHNELESADPAHLEAGANVLLASVLAVSTE